MKLLVLISVTLAAVSATSDPRAPGAPPTEPCYTKARGRSPPSECVFPFVYKGNTYYSCTTVDTINGEAWCGTRDTVRFTRSGKVVTGDVGDCDFQTSDGCIVDQESGEYCDTKQDCYSFGNACDPPPPGSSGCICKNNVCKLSSGCGTAGLNGFNKCSECSFEDCEDEGVCANSPAGYCDGPEDYPAPPPFEGVCDTTQDCYSFGNACDPPPPGSSGCICKHNVCTFSSGCGTAGLNWFNKCSECNAEDCEDEGACTFRRGRCTGPEDYPAPAPPFGHSSSCRTKSRGQCIFPFSYKGEFYDKCTYVDSKEPWCAVVPTVSLNSRGVIQDATEVDDCFLAPGSPCEVEEDNSCTYDSDCRAPGKLCETIADATCICKKGECKISSGCGTSGAFFFKSCSDCDTDLDGCEDEGACRISGSRSGLKSCISK